MCNEDLAKKRPIIYDEITTVVYQLYSNSSYAS